MANLDAGTGGGYSSAPTKKGIDWPGVGRTVLRGAGNAASNSFQGRILRAGAGMFRKSRKKGRS